LKKFLVFWGKYVILLMEMGNKQTGKKKGKKEKALSLPQEKRGKRNELED